MIENIKEADLIIFCITDPSRLSSPFKLPITTWQASDKNAFIEIDDGGKRYRRSHGIPSTKFDFHKLQEAIKHYYRMLYDDYHMETMHRGLLREIDAVVKQHNKKCIFLKCFTESLCSYTPENVVWGNLHLYEDISMGEFKHMSHNELKEIHKGKDERKNHLSDKNNYNMYLFLKDIIDKDDFTPREVKMEKYFE